MKAFMLKRVFHIIWITLVFMCVLLVWRAFFGDHVDETQMETYLRQKLSSNVNGQQSQLVDAYNPKRDVNINPEHGLCDEQSILFVVFVVIAPSYFERRHQIRSTWGNVSLYDANDFKLIFSLGMSMDDEVNKRIEEESLLHKDIVQMKSFNDSYHVMTTKIMQVIHFGIVY